MKTLLIALAIVGLLFSCQPTEDSSSEATESTEKIESPSIIGAWEITTTTNSDGETSTPYKSVIIYSEGFYSVEIAWEEVPSWEELDEGEERSEEEIRASYGRLTSNSGTYEIQGDSIIYNAIVAKHPNFMNDWPRWSRAYTLDGDNLVTTGERGSTTHKRIR